MPSRAPGLTATCHCGAVRVRVPRMSRTLTSCNCSICRRYGALKRPRPIVAVNAVNFEPSALVGARIRHLDGAGTWKFID